MSSLRSGHNARVKLADGARRGVARVGELRFARRLALRVGLLKRLAGHDDFAAHFKSRRMADQRQFLCLQAQGYGANGPDVGGYVLAHLAVAARDAAHQLAVLIGERHGKAIQLQFRHVFHLVAARQFAHAAVKVAQVVNRIGVVEAHHGRRVAHLGEFRGGRASHALRRGVGRDELRMLEFEFLQALHQLVELEVGDLRIVEHVVAVLVVADFVAQLGNFLLDVFGHGLSLSPMQSTAKMCLQLYRGCKPVRHLSTVPCLDTAAMPLLVSLGKSREEE